MLILKDREALARVGAEDIIALTEAAAGATFFREDLTAEQLAANRRIVEISAPSCIAAAASGSQMFAAAFVGDLFAGYVISTEHAPDDRELDWLMVHPRHHGSGVSAALMRVGMEWLGTDRPMWLNVIRYNERAIRFYRRFGFEIDPDTRTGHIVPHVIMRRLPA